MADPSSESWFQMAQTVWTDPRSASFAICAAILGTYWILSSITLVVDVTRRCRANKFQPEKWPDYVMLTDVIGHVLLQQAFLIVPTFYFLGPTIMSTFFSLSPELPSFQRLLFDLVSFVIGAEVWFYYTHRLFHHPSLYGPIHKWHHKYKAPFGFCALYFHPLEMLVQGGTLFFGPMIVGTHITIVFAIACVGMTAIVTHHAGYDVPGDKVPALDGSMAQFHDWHHVATKKNFGVLGWLDRLHGTDAGYHDYVKAWEAAKSRGGSAAKTR